MIGLNIWIGDLWENSVYIQVRESLLGSAGVGICPRLSKRCNFGLSGQYSGSYAPSNKLKLIRLWPFPFRYLVWHLITQVNDGNLAA